MFDNPVKPGVRRAVFYAYALAVLALAVYPFKETVGSSNDKINHILAFFVFYGIIQGTMG